MLLLVGLGNPGEKYADNRHNIGFKAIDEIARLHNFPEFKTKFQAELSEGRLGGEKCLLMKPQTYMNLSGQAVGEAARFYKIEPENVIVIHDELDLDFGKIRMKKGGGAAGHNGLKSIMSHLSPDFHRLRLGIGHPGKKEEVHDHVLKNFAKSDQDFIEDMLEAIAKHAPLLADAQHATFANKIHLDLAPTKPTKEEQE